MRLLPLSATLAALSLQVCRFCSTDWWGKHLLASLQVKLFIWSVGKSINSFFGSDFISTELSSSHRWILLDHFQLFSWGSLSASELSHLATESFKESLLQNSQINIFIIRFIKYLLLCLWLSFSSISTSSFQLEITRDKDGERDLQLQNCMFEFGSNGHKSHKFWGNQALRHTWSAFVTISLLFHQFINDNFGNSRLCLQRM